MQQALSFFMFLLQVKDKMGKKDKTDEERGKNRQILKSFKSIYKISG